METIIRQNKVIAKHLHCKHMVGSCAVILTLIIWWKINILISFKSLFPMETIKSNNLLFC